MYVCMHVCMYVCMFGLKALSTIMGTLGLHIFFIYIYIHVYIYIYIYIYIWVLGPSLYWPRSRKSPVWSSLSKLSIRSCRPWLTHDYYEFEPGRWRDLREARRGLFGTIWDNYTLGLQVPKCDGIRSHIMGVVLGA